MHRSYVPKEWIDAFIVDERHELPQDAITRFYSVLRVKPDESVAVFDGCGRQVVGIISKITANFIKAELLFTPLSNPEIVLVQAAIEEAKITETIQRGVEYGVDRFIIFFAERSDPYILSKLEKRLDRLMRIAQDASRQSERMYIPSIATVSSLKDVVQQTIDNMGLGVFGDPQSSQKFSEILRRQWPFKKPFWIVVGPEGGLSSSECDRLSEAGLTGVQWAPYVLRSELAGLSAIAIFNAINGRA